MKNFYATVGVQYTDENPHPDGLHADGYTRIVAPDYESARGAMNEAHGTKWAFIYDRREDFGERERGEIEVLFTSDRERLLHALADQAEEALSTNSIVSVLAALAALIHAVRGEE